jgi:transposase
VVFLACSFLKGAGVMGKRARRNHSPAFKAKVALEAVREQESVAEIARRYKLHANVVANWKRQLAENIERVFEAAGGDHLGAERESELLQKIGELTVERDFLAKGLGRLR